ncbi:MAG: hypothetical protein NW220_19540 [Leptolyngbyaceae cyanobacterium bins.349]|nr:hypothetical protein [Leptolyngbyaceae cyanobacterium bins.349]
MNFITAERRHFLAAVIFQPLTLYLIPAFLLVWFVSVFAVNIPYWDQWSLVDFFDQVASGTVSFQDFWAQHNEHRILFPKLIIVALAFLTQWNIGWELCVNVLLGCAIFLGIYWISAHQTASHDFIFHAANLTTCVAIFSLVQWENWLWGFQIAWFLINGCLILTILILARNALTWTKLCLVAMLCAIASFSSAHGLLIWIVVIPLIFVASKNIRHFIKVGLVWITLFGICYRLYFIEYQKPANHPALALSLQDIFQVKDYFLSFLGTGILYKSSITTWAGTLLILSFAYFFIIWLKRYNQLFFRQAAPWIVLGLFPILFGLLVAVGRSGLGVEQASSSRYTTVSLLLVVALIQLLRLELGHQLGLRLNERRIISPTFNPFSQYCLIIGASIVLLSVASAESLQEARSRQIQLQYGQRCLEIVEYLPTTQRDCLQTLHPVPAKVLQWSQTLQKIGFMKTLKPLEVDQKPTQLHGYFDPPTSLQHQTNAVLYIPKRCTSCELLKVKGWAINPTQKQAAQLVVLSYSDGIASPQTMIATATVGLPSPDVATALQSSRYAQARWETTLSAKFISAQKTVINAWMYDSVNRKLVKLDNTLKVEVEE